MTISMMDVKRLAEISGGGGRRAVQVQAQISLPWSEAVRISIKNVILRLGRAAITGTGIVLGIAFLTYVWSDAVSAMASSAPHWSKNASWPRPLSQ